MIKLTNEQITEELTGLYGAIFEFDCFGVNDLIRYELLLQEAEKRGLQIAQDVVDKENAELEI